MRARTAFALILLGGSTALGATVFAQSSPGGAPYVLIIHPNNSAVSIDRQFLEDAFLKKLTRWPDGEVIRPVDQAPDSTIRRKFTEEVLNRSVAAVKGYWQQRIFSGRDVPPPEVDNDEQVVRFVLKYDGAVGYVSPGAELNGSKVIPIK